MFNKVGRRLTTILLESYKRILCSLFPISVAFSSYRYVGRQWLWQSRLPWQQMVANVNHWSQSSFFLAAMIVLLYSADAGDTREVSKSDIVGTSQGCYIFR